MTDRAVCLSGRMAGSPHCVHLEIQHLVRALFYFTADQRRFLPIVLLALVFNLSNVLGFTYADRDAQKQRANSALSSGNILGFGFGGIGGQLVGGLVRNSLGRVLG